MSAERPAANRWREWPRGSENRRTRGGQAVTAASADLHDPDEMGVHDEYSKSESAATLRRSSTESSPGVPRRLKGRCFYCGRKRIKGLTCVSCRPLLALDPLYGPDVWRRDED